VVYEVELSSRAARDFLKLSPQIQRRIAARIDALAGDPRPSGCEKLTGTDSFRIRAGEHRIVYLVDDGERIVTVTRIGHRRDIYRRI
jgi:mRNA interferase RelE/StbE